MTGVATDMLLAIRELRIDLAGHGEHHAGGLLFFFIVRREIAHHVAERALHVQGLRERCHSRTISFRSQDLEVLRRSALAPTFLLSILGEESKRSCQKQREDYAHGGYVTTTTYRCTGPFGPPGRAP